MQLCGLCCFSFQKVIFRYRLSERKSANQLHGLPILRPHGAIIEADAILETAEILRSWKLQPISKFSSGIAPRGFYIGRTCSILAVFSRKRGSSEKLSGAKCDGGRRPSGVRRLEVGRRDLVGWGWGKDGPVRQLQHPCGQSHRFAKHLNFIHMMMETLQWPQLWVYRLSITSFSIVIILNDYWTNVVKSRTIWM